MIHFSLFSGIGGFDLASEWMGWKNYLSCEINEFGNKILEYYWADAYHHRDIHTLTYETIDIELSRRFGSDWRNDDIILTGGFPCQPYSMAGKRLGKEDERHLFPEMLRVIREVQPKWIVGENVLGIVNWSGGLVFEEVQADLEAAGYEVQSFLLPACGVNAPHRRDRVWFVAYSKFSASCRNTREISGKADQKNSRRQESSTSPKQQIQLPIESNTIFGNAKHANGVGQKRRLHSEQPKTTNGEQSGQPDARSFQQTRWENFPTQFPLCNGDDGISSRLDTITFSKWRNESIKGGGNAIVPQVVYQIFKSIEQYELSQQPPDPMG